MIVVDPLTTYHDVQIKAPARRYGRRWCHLEDTEGDVERLHAFAAKIGIPRRWFQQSVRGTFPHYDLTPRYRLRAVQAGAVEMTARDAAILTHEKARTNRHFPKGDYRYGKKLDSSGRVVGVYGRSRRLRLPSSPYGIAGDRGDASGGTGQASLPGFGMADAAGDDEGRGSRGRNDVSGAP